MSNPSTLTNAHHTKKAELMARVTELRAAEAELALMEQYEKLMAKAGVPGPVRLRANPANAGFSTLKKGDAVVVLLEETGKRQSADYLFDEMKKRGHAVASIGSLRTMLHTDPRFVLEDGEWGLSART